MPFIGDSLTKGDSLVTEKITMITQLSPYRNAVAIRVLRVRVTVYYNYIYLKNIE